MCGLFVQPRTDITSVIELPTSAWTAQLAADAVGTPLGSIVKSLVFMVDGRSILALVAGDRRADR